MCKKSEREHLEDLDVDWRVILKSIFKKWEGGHGLDWSGVTNCVP